ncbi:MAG: ABC transporter permease [Nitrospinota bacterium]
MTETTLEREQTAPLGETVVHAPERPRRLGRAAIIRILSLIVVMMVWEIYGRYYINPVLFTYPTAIAKAFVRLYVSGELWEACRMSLSVLFTGWLMGVVVGILVGLVMARSYVIEYATDLYVNALYATPIVALVPLIINWFGFSVRARIVIVFLFSVFPVLINTFQGVKNVEANLLEVARSFCSTERQLWRDVILPSSVPYIVAGLRLSIGRGLVGLVVAELFTSIAGLGAVIVNAQTDMENDTMFVPIIILMALGIVLSEGLKLFEQRIAPWKMRED